MKHVLYCVFIRTLRFKRGVLKGEAYTVHKCTEAMQCYEDVRAHRTDKALISAWTNETLTPQYSSDRSVSVSTAYLLGYDGVNQRWGDYDRGLFLLSIKRVVNLFNPRNKFLSVLRNSAV